MLGESMTRHSRHDDHHNTEVKGGGCLDQIDDPSPGEHQRQTLHMIFHILPSLNRLIHDLRMNQTRNPELDQRAVEILPPFLVNCLNRVRKGNGIGLHGEIVEGSWVRWSGAPPQAWSCPQKRQVFEFCGCGEVKRGHFRGACVRRRGVR